MGKDNLNEKMKSEILQEEIHKLREAIAALSAPPNTIGTFLGFHVNKNINGNGDGNKGGNKDGNKNADGNGPKGPEKLAIVTSDNAIRLVGFADRRLIDALKVGEGVYLSQTGAILGKFEYSSGNIVLTVGKQIGEGRYEAHENGTVRHVIQNLTGKDLAVGDFIITDGSKTFAIQNLGNTDTSFCLSVAPEVKWADVGGQNEAIEQLRENFELPLRHIETYQKHGVKIPKGALLYGPAGCGKTLLARALSYNLGLTMDHGKPSGYLYVVDGSSFFQKYVGVGEEMVRAVYATAQKKAIENNGVSVVVIDEAESAFRARGASISQDVSDSLVNSLLNCIDGFEARDRIITCILSNRPELLDDAILREGRIDVKIDIKRPDKEGTKSIFNIHLKKAGVRDIRNLAGHGAECVFASKALADEASGALVETIVNHASRLTAKREIEVGKAQSLGKGDIAEAARYMAEMRSRTRAAFGQNTMQSTAKRIRRLIE